MKTSKFIVTFLIVVVIVSGCDLFGPNKKKILAWVDNLQYDTRYSMVERYSAGGQSETYSYSITITDIDQRSGRTTVTLNFDGGSAYLIADDARGSLYLSGTSTIGDTSMIMLKTPVEVGTGWTGWFSSYILFDDFQDVRFRISATGGTRDAGSFTANDVVTVRVDLSGKWENVNFSVSEYYYSPTYGWLGDKFVFTFDGQTFTYETTVSDLVL